VGSAWTCRSQLRARENISSDQRSLEFERKFFPLAFWIADCPIGVHSGLVRSPEFCSACAACSDRFAGCVGPSCPILVAMVYLGPSRTLCRQPHRFTHSTVVDEWAVSLPTRTETEINEAKARLGGRNGQRRPVTSLRCGAWCPKGCAGNSGRMSKRRTPHQRPNSFKLEPRESTNPSPDRLLVDKQKKLGVLQALCFTSGSFRRS
jgi:hypothetical protein